MRLAKLSENDFNFTQQAIFPTAFQISEIGNCTPVTKPRSNQAVMSEDTRKIFREFTGNSGKNASFLRLYEVQDEVAKRIAYRLHDESAQMLAVIYLELENISRNAPENTVEKISGVVKKLDDLCDQLRQISHELRPVILDQFGLMAGLRFLADGIMKRSSLEVYVTGSLENQLSKPLQIVLYRVVQEALSNVVRHADASFADVKVWLETGSVHCTVTDNGKGILLDNSVLAVPLGLGLTSINERVAAIHGSCKIRTQRGKGTQLHIEIHL